MEISEGEASLLVLECSKRGSTVIGQRLKHSGMHMTVKSQKYYRPSLQYYEIGGKIFGSIVWRCENRPQKFITHPVFRLTCGGGRGRILTGGIMMMAT